MAGQGDYVHKIWSLSSQRFLELELPEDPPSEKEQGKSIFIFSYFYWCANSSVNLFATAT